MELQIIKSLNEPMFQNGRIQADRINHAANCFWDWTGGNRQDIVGFADELIRCSECVRNNMVMFSSTWLLALKAELIRRAVRGFELENVYYQAVSVYEGKLLIGIVGSVKE